MQATWMVVIGHVRVQGKAVTSGRNIVVISQDDIIWLSNGELWSKMPKTHKTYPAIYSVCCTIESIRNLKREQLSGIQFKLIVRIHHLVYCPFLSGQSSYQTHPIVTQVFQPPKDTSWDFQLHQFENIPPLSFITPQNFFSTNFRKGFLGEGRGEVKSYSRKYMHPQYSIKFQSRINALNCQRWLIGSLPQIL